MSEVISEGGDPIEEPAAVEAEATEAEATPAAEPAAPEFNTELQAELEHVRSQNAELFSLLEQYASQQGTSVEQAAQQQGFDVSNLTDEYGNLDPEKFARYQEARDQAIVSRMEQMFQPLQQTFQQQQEAATIAEGEQRLQDILESDISQHGEFASDPDADARARNLVTTLASQLFPDNAAKYGNGPRAAELSMTQAAAEVRSLLRSAGGAAVTQNQNQLATLAGAHGEPGAGGAGVEAPVIRLGETSAARFASGGANG